ncbi:craniofacial development protein 1 [Drosophila tropicalis]|uniref:craniofacial development protein 1 n=1 Tax=Drosophila tropicalis TaxID=46794 RepID=UPI0035ABFD6B
MDLNQEYASDSESDEDFCLENENAESGSCDEESAESEEEEEEANGTSSISRKKAKDSPGASNKDDNTARRTRNSDGTQNGRRTVEKEELESDEEVDKSRSDALWADFLNDVGEEKPQSSEKKTKSDKVEASKKPQTVVSNSPPTDAPKAPVTKITEVLDFAGEQVTVQKTVSSSSAKENQKQIAPGKRPANGGGLGSFLNTLGKKKKMSVLEKSQLDWKTFKKDEGIDEELRTHNMGKDGYLERQDFLQRTDLRQFEIEKNLRQSRRQN